MRNNYVTLFTRLILRVYFRAFGQNVETFFGALTITNKSLPQMEPDE